MSIQFASPFSESGPGITSVSDDSASIMAASVDAAAQTLAFTFRDGTATVSSGKTSAFTADPAAPQLVLTFSLATNVWSTSDGRSGQMTTAEITAAGRIMAAVMAAVQDGGELFAFNRAMFGAGSTNNPW